MEICRAARVVSLNLTVNGSVGVLIMVIQMELIIVQRSPSRDKGHEVVSAF